MANLEWDSRLDELHVKVIPCNAPPGQEYWKLIKAKYEDENESGGNHNVYLTLIDENGAPVAGQEATVYYPGKEPTRPTNNEGKMDMPIFAGGPPWDPKVSGHGGPYGAKVMGAASDRIEGMGMPMHLHVNYRLTFQKTTATGADEPIQQPAPPPKHKPMPEERVAKPVSGGSVAGLEWDERLDEMRVKLIPYNAQPGEPYWKLIKGKFNSEQESGGRHNVYVKLEDENGAPIVGHEVSVYWPDGAAIRPTNQEGKYDEPIFAEYDPEKGQAGPYGVKVVDAQGRSDRAEGMGLPNKQHVNFIYKFQRTTAQAEALGRKIAEAYAQRGRTQFQTSAAPRGVFQAGWNAAVHGQAVSQEFPVVLGNRGVTMQLFENALLYHNPDTNQAEPFPNVSLDQIYQSVQSGGPGLELVGRLL